MPLRRGPQTPQQNGSGGLGRTIFFFMSHIAYSSDTWNQLLTFKNQQVEALQRQVLELQSKLNSYEQSTIHASDSQER